MNGLARGRSIDSCTHELHPVNSKTADTICIVMHDFGAGGTERIAIRLANAWADAGRSVSILCGSAVGPLIRLVGPDVNVIETAPPIVRGWRSREKLGRKQAAVIDRLTPAVVFIPGNFHARMVTPLLSNFRRPRPRLAMKLSNPIRRCSRNIISQFVFESELRQTLLKVDAIIAMAPALYSEAQSIIGHPNLVTIMEPILSDGDLIARTAKPSCCELIAAGRLVRQKNFGLAIEALAEIKDERTRLTIYGEGTERKALESLAARLGLSERVSMPGYIPDIRNALAESHLFLLPSLYEGYPAVAIEALAAGAPVITTANSPAIRDIIRGASLGTVLEHPDARNFASAIQERRDQPDLTEPERIEIIERHRIGPISQQYLRVFDQMLTHPIRAT